MSGFRSIRGSNAIRCCHLTTTELTFWKTGLTVRRTTLDSPDLMPKGIIFLCGVLRVQTRLHTARDRE